MRLDVEQRGRAGNSQGSRRSGPERTADRETWKMKRSGPFSSVRLAIMRLLRSWELLAAVALGILVAVVLICTVPLYNTLVADLQLQRAINAQGAQSRNVEAQAQSDTVDASLRAQSAGVVSGLAQRYLHGFVSSTSTYYATSDSMLIVKADSTTYDPANPATSQGSFLGFDLAAVAPHIRYIAGSAPAASASSASGPQALVTQEMAKDLKLTVGSTISLVQFGNHQPVLTVHVAGVFAPNDENDPYWNGLTFSAGGGSNAAKVYPLLVSYDTFFSQLAKFSSVGMRQHWVYYTRPEAINTGNMASIQQNVEDFRSHLSGQVLTLPGVAKVGVISDLDSTIGDIQSQEALLALPLYVIVAQVVGLALLFVAAMAGLLIEGQSQDIATLKSRGASGPQLLSTFTMQGVLLAVIAAIAGPFVAAFLGLALIHWFVPSNIVNGAGVGASYFTQAANPKTVAVPALIGALLGVGAVAFSAYQSARLDVLAFRREQGRATRAPLWRRYYLDVALAVLCLVGYVELDQFGGIGTRQQLGSASSSPLLLVTPALLLLAGALIVLRIFPMGAALGARIAARGKGLTPLLAFSQVERSPRRYSRMTLLLVLAVGLGLFALTFDASLQQNARDRATYTAGADMRINVRYGEGNGRGARFAQQLAQMPSVLSVAQTYRTQANTTPDQGSNQIDVLGIDPTTFEQVAGSISWRSDYASEPLSTLMNSMRSNIRGTNAGTASAPIWALVSDQFASALHIGKGDKFSIQLSENPFGTTAFVVGGIVHEFPTLYPGRAPGSFMVADLNDYFAAIESASPNGDTSLIGPNEFWLKTTHNAAGQANIQKALQDPNDDVDAVVTLSDQLAQTQGNPVAAGMRGLLLVGAVTAAVLAILGSIVQSLLAARQRATQFAVLRTVGMAGYQLSGLLLGEQVVVYLFGLLGGTVLGLLLVTATLPFLQFSDTTIDPSRLGIPPYDIIFNVQGIGIFYLSLMVAFAVALLIAARYATTIGLGNALRLGED